MNNQLPTLRAAAVELPGYPGLWVRAHLVAKALGVQGSGWPNYWERRGLIHPVRIKVPVARGNTHGVEVYFPLAEIPVMAARVKSRARRHWTDEEWNRVEMLMGRYSLRSIAKQTGRTFEAIRREMTATGRSLRKVLLMRHGLVSRAGLAKMVGRSVQAVAKWLDRSGLGYHVIQSERRRERYVRLPEFVAWLMGHVQVARGLAGSVLRRLRLAVDGDRVVRIA